MNIIKRIPAKIIGKVLFKLGGIRGKRRVHALIARGLVIGKNVTIEPKAGIDSSYPYLISIGDNCSIAGDAQIMAHDATAFKFTGGYAKLGRVVIKDNCFIGRGAIILPGVTIGPNVVVAAGSVVNKDIPPNSCVAGVPARFYTKFDEMMARHETQIKEGTVFEFLELHQGLNDALIEKVRKSVENGHAYVKGFPFRYPFLFDG